uniref:Uncharacterized protein n=1 Tax=Pipistrellus kuhlii TaxID=59472 RepID=A0A7J7SFL0_PIPKU|nr:hypothetical protein mPipKuh1_009976 [Pipistrellus kuhlii]
MTPSLDVVRRGHSKKPSISSRGPHFLQALGPCAQRCFSPILLSESRQDLPPALPAIFECPPAFSPRDQLCHLSRGWGARRDHAPPWPVLCVFSISGGNREVRSKGPKKKNDNLSRSHSSEEGVSGRGSPSGRRSHRQPMRTEAIWTRGTGPRP